ncbi:MAG: CatB-related O-acetyltransferase [Proteobacteria bacterium]|nr:CatB-related O-acetyltransferase [Pseudomonadota bacterium]
MPAPPKRHGIFCSANSKIEKDAKLIPPVRLYGNVVVGAQATIGKYTYIGSRTRIAPKTKIGNYCSIARDVEVGPATHPLTLMSTHPFQYSKNHFPSENYKLHKRVKVTSTTDTTVSIGNDVWIGAKVVIMRGVKIGDGAILGSSAVVTKDVPPYAIVAGIPAQIIRYRFDDQIIQEFKKLKWWEMNPIDMNGVDYTNVSTAIVELASRKKTYIQENKRILSGDIKNNFSGSAKGCLWFRSKFGHLNKKFFKKGQLVKIQDVQSDVTFNNQPTNLALGVYEIVESHFNLQKNSYRIRIANENGIYQGAIGKNAITFSLIKK